jgi:TP901 family phage tail tape measure protein
VADNVVTIRVTSKNDSQPGFDEASAGADELAAKVDEAMGEYSAAMDKAAEANERLAEAQADPAATADELAAAQDRVTEATLASIDAQVKLGQAELEQSAAAHEAGDAQEESAGKSDLAGESALGLGSKMKLAALGMAAGAAISIKMAADWQESLTQLVTGAGEPVKAMGMIRQAILGMSVGTNTSVQDLTAGLYMISSAGYHGAAGLDVLKAAAEGAKVGNAQLADVSNVLTSVMNAYRLPASKAVAVTDELVATTAAGKMHMQDLATALSSVLPVAASAHISFAQVGGALATMTMQGMSARRSSMELANMIRSLLDPTTVASGEMSALGLNANKVADDLGTRGLTGTLSVLTEAILRNTHGGSVMASTMKQMTPAAQALAEQVLRGSISTKQLSDATESLNPKQAALVTAFAKSAAGATGLKQTFDAAMAKMVGGATGLNVALMVGGKHMSAFKANAESIADSAAHAGQNVNGWKDIQGDFNFKLGQAGKALQAVAYSLGDALLPAATKVMGVIADFGEWLTKNKIAAYALAAVIIGVLATVIGGKLVSSVHDAMEAFSALADSEILQGIASKAAAAAQWLLNVAMDANPVMLVVLGIGLLVAAFVVAVTHFKAFRDFWIDTWHVITAAVAAAWHVIDKIVMSGVNLVRDVVDAQMQALEQGWDAVWSLIGGTVKTVWDLIRTIIGTDITIIRDIIDAVLAVLQGHWSQAWHYLLDAATAQMHAIQSMIRDIGGTFINILYDAGRDIIEGLIHGIEDAAGGLMSVVSGIGHDVSSAFSSVLSILSPSKVFAEHGRDIVRGLIEGIDETSPMAVSSVRRLAGSLTAAGHATGGGYAAGGGQIVLQVTPGGSGLDELFITWLKHQVRVRGGGSTTSVQRALGQRWPTEA